jgi:parallel beta-helix repeat protein
MFNAWPALVLLALVSCSSAAAIRDGVPDQLPGVAQLDSLKGGSAVASDDVVVFAPLGRSNTHDSGGGLDFEAAQAGQVAWAIYRVPNPGGTLISVTGAGGQKLYMMVADYGAGNWSKAASFSTGAPHVDLTTLSPVSPAGYIYIAVVCTPQLAGTLTALHLEHDSVAPSGNTYYVSNGGDDGDDGSQLNPWETLQHAADVVGPGDTVQAMPGNYAGFHLQTSGEPDNPITFKGAGATIVSDNPDTPDGINIENWDGPPSIAYVLIDGIDVSGATRTGIRVAGTDSDFAHHITIRNCTLDGNGRWGVLSGHVDDMLVGGNTCSHSGAEHGIYLSNSGDRNVARDNICFGNNACGIQFNADATLEGDGTMSDVLIENNVLYDNGAAGGSALNTDGLRRAVIRNNLIYGNHASGIVLYNGDGVNSGENLVVNNTVVMPADGRWCITIGDGSTGNRIYNNVLYNNHPFRGVMTLDDSSLPGFFSDYNVLMDRLTADDGDTMLTLAQWQMQFGWDTHSIVSTPDAVFVNAAADDYHLKPGSAAIAVGLDAITPAFDLSGIARAPGIDAGCFEFVP